jgi:hypothetical protein
MITIYASRQNDVDLFDAFESQMQKTLENHGFKVIELTTNRQFSCPEVSFEIIKENNYYKKTFPIQKAKDGYDGWGQNANRFLQLTLNF